MGQRHIAQNDYSDKAQTTIAGGQMSHVDPTRSASALKLNSHLAQNDVTMFITTNTWHRRPVFADPAFARKAVDHLYRLQESKPFLLYGFVVMPDHLHFLLQVRSPYTISELMNVYKTGLTFESGIGAFWQDRFDLRIPEDAFRILRYIHVNPRKAGLCKTNEEYPWSSASGKWEVTPIA